MQKISQPRNSRLGRGFESLRRRLTNTHDACQVVARIVAAQRPQVVWVDHAFLAPLLAKVPSGSVLQIVDTQDVMHLRDASLRQSGVPAEAGINRQQETQLLQPFDVVVAIQNRERLVLQEMVPHKRVITVEHAVGTNPQPCRRKSLCFVGSGYVVNVETVLSFVARGWPRIRALCPEATLEIVGGVCGNRRVQAAAALDVRIVLRGVVSAIADMYDGPAAIICPLWMGSGLKIKLVEALAHGKATIASPIAAQGLEDGVNQGFIQAATPEAFVEPAVRLLTDEVYRDRWARRALRYAARFDSDVVYRQLDRLLFANNAEPVGFPAGGVAHVMRTEAALEAHREPL